MKRAWLIVPLLVTPALLIVRAVVRYNEQQTMMDRVFGTEEERQKGSAKIIAAGRDAEGAGASAGAHETEKGCLEKGFEGEKTPPRQYAKLMHFLEGCLRTAKPTPGFCDQVPLYRATMSPADEERSRAYQDAVCRKEGFTDLNCRAGVRMVQLHCHPLE